MSNIFRKVRPFLWKFNGRAIEWPINFIFPQVGSFVFICLGSLWLSSSLLLAYASGISPGFAKRIICGTWFRDESQVSH